MGLGNDHFHLNTDVSRDQQAGFSVKFSSFYSSFLTFSKHFSSIEDVMAIEFDTKSGEYLAEPFDMLLNIILSYDINGNHVDISLENFDKLLTCLSGIMNNTVMPLSHIRQALLMRMILSMADKLLVLVNTFMQKDSELHTAALEKISQLLAVAGISDIVVDDINEKNRLRQEILFSQVAAHYRKVSIFRYLHKVKKQKYTLRFSIMPDVGQIKTFYLDSIAKHLFTLSVEQDLHRKKLGLATFGAIKEPNLELVFSMMSTPMAHMFHKGLQEYKTGEHMVLGLLGKLLPKYDVGTKLEQMEEGFTYAMLLLGTLENYWLRGGVLSPENIEEVLLRCRKLMKNDLSDGMRDMVEELIMQNLHRAIKVVRAKQKFSNLHRKYSIAKIRLNNSNARNSYIIRELETQKRKVIAAYNQVKELDPGFININIKAGHLPLDTDGLITQKIQDLHTALKELDTGLVHYGLLIPEQPKCLLARNEYCESDGMHRLRSPSAWSEKFKTEVLGTSFGDLDDPNDPIFDIDDEEEEQIAKIQSYVAPDFNQFKERIKKVIIGLEQAKTSGKVVALNELQALSDDLHAEYSKFFATFVSQRDDESYSYLKQDLSPQHRLALTRHLAQLRTVTGLIQQIQAFFVQRETNYPSLGVELMRQMGLALQNENKRTCTIS